MANIVKSLAVVGLVTLLSGCASSPKAVILSPSYSAGQVTSINQPVSVKVEDLRTSKFTVKVLDREPAVYLPDANLPVTLSALINDAFTTNGADVVRNANVQVTVQIKQFLALVSETYTKHESNAQAEFVVTVTKGKSTFVKSFTGNRKLTGSLKHDQAKVEGQLNVLAQQLVAHMIKDQELVQFISQ
ncbi:YajG family lipoprotein [Pseudoalteromonas luteoviolacea]|uniref:Lipoprotein n=1 Tax=Pseudoalteromonas luteoviolacea DSM 6061 TaxID=1365250 RepID=A0A167BRP3_9GAMM|nr:YajG family lipoprotein [Pseudoalteromonas luteoviolacea]KZN46827.1 hypothetical protein N475_07405 [Pseudoalteromonas luteoviolacea DSM 6061]KZN50507.1 hypothetical protein N474_03810 [Pseudoalteromonas luteoviolacea CPMOR-2]MBE0385038.1 putative lipoprotein [Pseudoalteromonas luteoviolacea DSM 6061]TQF69704.1 hypothetical protein FLM44_00905 [Pseudoalteromonas luteoviolacea]